MERLKLKAYENKFGNGNENEKDKGNMKCKTQLARSLNGNLFIIFLQLIPVQLKQIFGTQLHDF